MKFSACGAQGLEKQLREWLLCPGTPGEGHVFRWTPSRVTFPHLALLPAAPRAFLTCL